MYGSIANLKLRMGVASAAHDALLTALLTTASNVVDQMSGHSWPVGSLTVSYYRMGTLLADDDRTLFLRGVLTSIATLTNGDGTVIGLASYVLEPARETRRGMVVLKAASGYRFNFGAGEDGAITVNSATWAAPEQVEEAAYILAEAYYRQGEENAVTVEQAMAVARAMLGYPLALGAA